MTDTPQYDEKTYDTARIFVREGNYTRKELQDMIAWMDRINAANKKAMQTTKEKK